MNIYRGLLFLHGHLLRPEDAIDPSPSANVPAPAPLPARVPAHVSKPDGFGLLGSLSFPGGRSMRAGRTADVDPPLEQRPHGCESRAGPR